MLGLVPVLAGVRARARDVQGLSFVVGRGREYLALNNVPQRTSTVTWPSHRSGQLPGATGPYARAQADLV